MGRTRFLVGTSAFALTLSLATLDARAISLPDTSSPCATTSADGCLKITNTDSSGVAAFVADATAGYGTGIVSKGFVGLDVQGSIIGITASSNNIGLTAGSSYANFGVQGWAYLYGVQGSASSSGGKGVYGTVAASGSYGVYGNATGTNAFAVYGSATNTGGQGVYGTGLSSGVHGVGGWNGVLGEATGDGRGVAGTNTSSSGWAGYFDGKVYASAGYTSSDARLKKDVAGLVYGLKDLAALRPVTFKWKDTNRGDGRHVGFIAQEIQKVVPEIVDQDAKSGMLSVDYPGLVPVLVKGMQEQQAIIARQDARIAALEQRPVLSSMFSGGINVSVAIGAFAALVLNLVIRRRKQQHPS